MSKFKDVYLLLGKLFSLKSIILYLSTKKNRKITPLDISNN